MEAKTGTVLVALGDSFESSSAAVMYHARSLVNPNSVPVAKQDVQGGALGDGVQTQWYEDWYDGLGYCTCDFPFPLLLLFHINLLVFSGTWNALGQRLTHEKVLNALSTLDNNGIKIASLIIDDNWQDIDYRGNGQWQYGWNDFEAEPKTFPQGLKGLVSEIREKHRNIQHIAVWYVKS